MLKSFRQIFSKKYSLGIFVFRVILERKKIWSIISLWSFEFSITMHKQRWSCLLTQVQCNCIMIHGQVSKYSKTLNLQLCLNERIRINDNYKSSHYYCFTRGARYITDFDGWLIFCTIFHEDSKNIYFFQNWTHLIDAQALPP